jgi:hypothetical protein
MKKSFIRRAIASAIAVPLALTQSLMPVLAVEDVSDVTAVVDSAATMHFTAASLTNIEPGETESNWNTQFSQVLITLDDFEKSVDVDVVRNFIVSKAGAYSELATSLADQIKNTTVSRSFLTNSFTIKGQVDDLSTIIFDQAQGQIDSKIADVVDQYSGVDFTPIKNIDFSSIHLAADVEIVVNTANVKSSKTFGISYVFKAEDGNTYTLDGDNSIIDYVQGKYNECKALVVAAKDELFADVRQQLDDATAELNEKSAQLDSAKTALADAEAELDEAEANGVNVDDARAKVESKKSELADAETKRDEAQAKLNQAEIDYKNAGGEADKAIDDIFAGYDQQFETIRTKYDYIMNKESISVSGNSLTEVLTKYKTIGAEKYTNIYNKVSTYYDQIPTSAGEVAERVAPLYSEIFDQLKDQIPSSVEVDLDVNDVAEIFDNLYNVSLTVENGKAELVGYMDDDQIDELNEYYAKEGKEVVSSVKKVEASFNTKVEGDVYYNVTRILELKDIDTTTTTTTTTTDVTTTTTTDVTTTDDESTTTTTSTTGSETTTTTSVTTGDDSTTTTTDVTTTDDQSTTTTTTDATDVTTTTTDVTTTDVTDVTTTDVTDVTTTTTDVTTTDVTDVTTTDVTDVTTTTTDVTTSDTTATTTVTTVSYVINADSFYFSHDDENFADKDGFSVIAIDEDGNETVLTADDYDLNYASPYEASESRADVTDWTVENFKYEITAIIGEDEVTATVYIGKKGDADLDNAVNSSDGSSVLAYYAAHSSNKDDALYSDEDETLEAFALFLADTDENGIFNSSDASNILDFYAQSSSNLINTNEDVKSFWNAKLS